MLLFAQSFVALIGLAEAATDFAMLSKIQTSSAGGRLATCPSRRNTGVVPQQPAGFARASLRAARP